MARYRNVLQTTGPAIDYEPAIHQYLISEGFALDQYQGKPIWKKGDGFVTAPQYISIECEGETVVLEAFLRYAILPGVYAGEMGTTGFIGALPKRLLKGRVDSVEAFIRGQRGAPAMDWPTQQ